MKTKTCELKLNKSSELSGLNNSVNFATVERILLANKLLRICQNQIS